MENSFKDKALEYHSTDRAGKTATMPTKPVESPEQLALAYTPGVAAPAMEISKERWRAYRYTNKGNLVAVVSNGSSLLGLGNKGALASKPVMEGKAMLFKTYADIDAFDIEISDEEPEKIVATIQSLAPTFGGINIEDIKAPECFYIEKRLRELLDIPVLHDDQHGTAVTVAAALLNACKVTGKSFNEIKIVINGAGAAAIASANMLLEMGIEPNRITMLDSKGVINTRRTDINEMKRRFATDSKATTLSQAIDGSDVFIGLSKGGLLSDNDIKSMAESPIIFALANPEPEISYSRAKQLRADAVVATGRSDSPNQINNVLSFPYLFRGALDTLSTTINEAMKIAAARAIAGIAQEEITKEITEQYGRTFTFGHEYILPKPSDRRLLTKVSAAVAQAAMTSGVARRGIASFSEYSQTLLRRVDNGNFFAREYIRHKIRHYGTGRDWEI
ncbi:MAG: malate dehydrogenase [Bacteroidaceae bacterium]|nr:malate dehydrogenase [Bacteroidaceae bacterium]